MRNFLPTPVYTGIKCNKCNSSDISIAYVRKLSVTNRQKLHLQKRDKLLEFIRLFHLLHLIPCRKGGIEKK